ncbi:nicotianamine synthase [Phtheirospermum japonicum]|uniref:Nicotianamine synthase n=1 Tax=Phtheirospermum japonicum TaxID=374723 RepID=A0A830BU32_9LAMI|nr:nicotianamine synthase [Phtheirospermum japonicum]
MAARLVGPHSDMSGRMEFRTTDIMDVSGPMLRDYDVVFLAALVGMEVEEKMRVVEYLAEHMAPGAILMLRSAHGARAFLYPVVEPRNLRGFEVLSVYHPTDDVINSVVVARKCPEPVHAVVEPLIPCSKCGEIQGFNNPLIGHRKMIEEFSCQDHVC